MRDLATEYVPLVRTQGEYRIVSSIMKDADVVRMSAEFADTYEVDDSWRLWLDPGFDGYEFVFENGWYGKGDGQGWHGWIQQFNGYDLLQSESNASDAAQGDVDDFVARVLDSIVENDPHMISVPQVPYGLGTARHGINRKLAKATGKWKESNWPKGTLILPAVLLHHDAYRTRAASSPKVNAISRALELSRATGVWIVHADFDDLAGKGNFDRDRFPSLIGFHEQLAEALPAKTFTCAGPYWGINLILWARGIVDVPVIGCGGAYRYYLPKPPQVLQRASTKIAIPPLRRWYGVNSELLRWVKTAKGKFPPRNEVREALQQIESSLGQFLGPGGRTPAMRQSAEFYYDWLCEIREVQLRGRGLFLFQDFSKAVVNGSHIGTKLPKQSGLSSDARDPGFIAQQFMLQCLPR